MALKDLFKTKAERRAYAIGRKHQAAICGKSPFKKTNVSKNVKLKRSSINNIPLNYQHNVLFSDERYYNIYHSYIRDGLGTEEAYTLAIPMYKKKYGDSVLKKHILQLKKK